MSSPSFLVINVCRIGDTVLATAALRAIARHYPDSEITCLGHPKRVEVLAKLPFLSQIGGITKGSARLRGWLPGRKWDYALVYGFDEPLVKYALRVANKVVAFRQHNQLLNQDLYKVVDYPRGTDLHGTKTPLLLAEALGIPADGYYASYTVTPEEQSWAMNLLTQQTPPGSYPLVGILIESFPTKAYRDWPAEHFADLCRRIVEQYDKAHFVVLGSAVSRHKLAHLKDKLGSRLTILSSGLSLRQSAAVMSRLSLYIGVDTGPTHIAGALRIPMVAMYHCLHPSPGLRPLDNPNARAIDHPLSGKDCTAAATMADISVDRVMTEVASLLGKV